MDIATHAIPGIAAFVLQASLKATLLVALVLLAQNVLNKVLPANVRYLLWFTVVVALVTPVGYEAPLLPERDTAATLQSVPANAIGAAPFVASKDTEVRAIASPLSTPATTMRTEQPVMTETLPRSWLSLLPYVWLAGVLAMLGAIAVSSRRFARLVHRAQPAATNLQDLLQACMRSTSCTSAVNVLESAEVDVPMIAGQFRPVLLLPVGLARQLTGAQLRHIFIHELMHLQRGDIAGNWLVAVAQALHWFNPVVWFAFFRMRQDRELACDAATMRHLAPADRAAYGYTLLQLNDTAVGARIPAPALGMLEARSHLKRRIHMLASTSKRSTIGRIIATLIALPLAALAFSQPVPAAREDRDAGIDAVAAEPLAAAPAAPAQDARVIPQAATAERSVVIPAPAQVAAAPAAATPAPAASAATPFAATPTPAPQARGLEAPADAFAAAPAITVVAAASVQPLPIADVKPAVDAEPTVDAAELAELTTAIAAAKSDGIEFIEKWNAIGNACDARKDGFLGALSANCQRIRTAQRRGEVFRFAFTCYQLNAWQERLEQQYGAAEALRASARDLGTFCSKDTYSTEYPAFAAMFEDAEALKYYPRRSPNNVDLARARNLAALYRSYGTTTTSMFVSETGNSFTMGPYEPSFNVQPNGWATGTVDPGWNAPAGGSMGEAPSVAPQ